MPIPTLPLFVIRSRSIGVVVPDAVVLNVSRPGILFNPGVPSTCADTFASVRNAAPS